MYNIRKIYVHIMYLSIILCDICILLNEKVPDIKVFRLISGIIVYLFKFFPYFA